jgi:hypothetical protein
MSEVVPLRRVADDHTAMLAKLRQTIEQIEAGEISPDVLCIVIRDRREQEVLFRHETEEPRSTVMGVLQFAMLMAYGD